MNLTDEIYQAGIPNCCTLRTTQEHIDKIALCWGLVADIECGHDTKNNECGRECWYHRNHDPELLDRILKQETPSPD